MALNDLEGRRRPRNGESDLRRRSAWCEIVAKAADAARQRQGADQMAITILTPSRINGQSSTARMAERMAPMVPMWSKKW